MKPRRVVVDTNVVLSATLKPISVPADALRRVLDEGLLIWSTTTLDELAEVLFRPKFDPYSAPEERRRFLELLLDHAQIVPVFIRVNDCRDPRDNHVLESAINGRAETIVTGDADLLALDPYHGIRILTPQDFLALPG